MRNIRLWLKFDGAGYHGWQSQKNALSVCEVITDALNALTGEDIKLYGCSRTDAGVHARIYCASFNTKSPIGAERLPFALNFRLPGDIRAVGAEDMPPDFHAQYSCMGKEYVYRLHCGRFDDPFYRGRVYHYRYGELDVQKMDEAAKFFIGTHDFSSCMAKGSQAKSTVRTVKYFNVEKKDGLIEFTVYADGFLYNMVRIMSGTLVEAGRGKIMPHDIEGILISRDRRRAGLTLPPHGLYLTKVDYTV
ncbi:MAG: tRNA pseudouridine(38-40) synthase TruA [Clostridia bacterium]|nr:tRNA pseudouridine(38-40) synthase TruA [Clostridia bacterium]